MRKKRICIDCGKRYHVQESLPEGGWICGDCMIKRRELWKNTLMLPIIKTENRLNCSWFAEIRCETVTLELEENIWKALDSGWPYHSDLALAGGRMGPHSVDLRELENNGRCISVVVTLEKPIGKVQHYVYDLGLHGRHKSWCGRSLGQRGPFYAGTCTTTQPVV